MQAIILKFASSSSKQGSSSEEEEPEIDIEDDAKFLATVNFEKVVKRKNTRNKKQTKFRQKKMPTERYFLKGNSKSQKFQQ
ncbi:hypothetical protein RND71_036857 [Anisodus tanguticus]|uniref:Uncharacterized protein n=1 Tax=Anisodus tanguticus TaxID=243964 RepID=A0AAE1UT44_9SOLA|nr:hypothetical protein RND71_036857 [Anisodus tanguticus]